MTCRYFEDGALCRCRAVRGLLVPSLHERERYCLSDPARCPTRRLRDLAGQSIDEESYYDLWLAGPGGSERPGEQTGAPAAPPAPGVKERHPTP